MRSQRRSRPRSPPSSPSVETAGGSSVFSVRDDDVRRAVDLVDDAGGAVVAVNPKRDSLEDYFARMMAMPASAAARPADEEVA